MTLPINFTRREFLHTGLASVSTIGSMPMFLTQSAQAAGRPGAPGRPDHRILVVVQLSGGNDGLNTVVPLGNQVYHDVRPRLAIPEKDVLKLGKNHQVGLHPKMQAMQQLYDDGLLNIVQGVGYPNPNRSHFASMDIWHTGDSRGGHGVGWLGAALDEQSSRARKELDATACVYFGKTSPLAVQGKKIKPIAFEDPNLFRWTGSDLHPALREAYNQLNQEMNGLQTPSGEMAFVMRTALNAQVASDRIRKAVSADSETRFPKSELANQLKRVAAMIRAELPTRVYYVAMGGFDTHANQAYGHGENLQKFSQAMLAFQHELKALGRASDVLTLAFSEFGRRVAQNASNGTDHGCAGPMFLFGEPVKPGVSGSLPSLTRLDKGDLRYHTDFRSVYASVLDQWMQINSTKVLGRAYRPAPVLRFS